MGIPVTHPAILQALARGLIAPRARAVRAPTLPAGLPEAQFQAAVVAVAESHGWLTYHTHDSRRSAPGFPDLVLVRDGELLFSELKVGKNRTTASQDAWLAALACVPGIRACCWRPEQWAEIVATLTRIAGHHSSDVAG